MTRFTAAFFPLLAFCSAAYSKVLPSIAQLVTTTPALKKLLHTLEAHEEFLEPLSNCGAGPFTVFAPTNKSFKQRKDILRDVDMMNKAENIDKDEDVKAYLGNVLGFHVLTGEVRLSDMKDGEKFSTLIEEPIMAHVNNNAIRITPSHRDNGAKVLENDIEACNGVVHIVNSLLIPPLPEIGHETEVSEDMETSDEVSEDMETSDEASEDMETSDDAEVKEDTEVTVDDVRKPPKQENFCAGKKVKIDNLSCFKDDITMANVQAGTNVTRGYKGENVNNINSTATPILTPYFEAGLCPVNVHWHLGAEHLSVGQYDESGNGPTEIHHRRKLAGMERLGYQCTLYDENDSKFTDYYEWKHCLGMEVGQTYEVHWPHSKMGACGTPNQYQTPFYDGVFCHVEKLEATNTDVGVQAQVFTVVNDESYYYPELMRGMLVDGEYGSEITIYTGSTTGTSRDNEICSGYSPITWQVDRECHLISASTFDKMCADMKAQRDDMSEDLHAHGSRPLVADNLAALNHVYLP